MYYKLPLSEDPRQVFTLDLNLDGNLPSPSGAKSPVDSSLDWGRGGVTFHARTEIRYLPAPDQWVISVWDNSSGELLVNQIPLVCSYGEVNDLFRPFRPLWEGRGMGTLIVLRAADEPRTENPSAGNLTEFCVLWGK